MMQLQREMEGSEVAVTLWARPSLTPREGTVLELIAQGLATRRVAEQLFVSEQAVTYHVGNLLGKFGCENRAGLVSRAYVLGFIDPRTWPPRLVRAEPPQAVAGRA